MNTDDCYYLFINLFNGFYVFVSRCYILLLPNVNTSLSIQSMRKISMADIRLVHMFSDTLYMELFCDYSALVILTCRQCTYNVICIDLENDKFMYVLNERKTCILVTYIQVQITNYHMSASFA